ncbi:hypothetical protein, partial [Burkholderia orbicola]|uniref:hypothetical protein n=1 Tax=Burkholderia orbicola TaxID=2978683 RepID=UPI00264A72D2
TGFLLLNALYKAAAKNSPNRNPFAFPSDYVPRGSPRCAGVSLHTSRAGSSDVRFVQLSMLIY